MCDSSYVSTSILLRPTNLGWSSCAPRLCSFKICSYIVKIAFSNLSLTRSTFSSTCSIFSSTWSTFSWTVFYLVDPICSHDLNCFDLFCFGFSLIIYSWDYLLLISRFEFCLHFFLTCCNFSYFTFHFFLFTFHFFLCSFYFTQIYRVFFSYWL